MFGDLVVGGGSGALPGLALLAVAVGEQAEDVGRVGEAIEPERQADPDRHREPLAERAGRDLDPGGPVHVRDGPGGGSRSGAGPSGPGAGSSRARPGPRTGSAPRGPWRARSGRARATSGSSDRAGGPGSRGRRRCRRPKASCRGAPTWRPRASARSASGARWRSARAPRSRAWRRSRGPAADRERASGAPSRAHFAPAGQEPPRAATGSRREREGSNERHDRRLCAAPMESQRGIRRPPDLACPA